MQSIVRPLWSEELARPLFAVTLGRPLYAVTIRLPQPEPGAVAGTTEDFVDDDYVAEDYK